MTDPLAATIRAQLARKDRKRDDLRRLLAGLDERPPETKPPGTRPDPSQGSAPATSDTSDALNSDGITRILRAGLRT